VNFDKIYSDYEDYKRGCFEKSPASNGTTANLTKPNGGASESTGSTQNSSKGFSQYTYNNINNTIDNNMIENIIDDKGSRCEDTRSAAAAAAAPGMSSQPLREKNYTHEELEKVENDFFSWMNSELRVLEKKYKADESFENSIKMSHSDEYETLMDLFDKKRADLIQEYGPYLKI